MPEFLIIDTDKPYTQDAWTEVKDNKGRIIKPGRPARDEVEVSMRLDRQYRAVLRLPKADATGPDRHGAIASACAKFALGDEIAPGIQIVEMEQRFTPAQQATIAPEQRDAQGNVLAPESFTAAQEERNEVSFTLRSQGMHLVWLRMTEAEMAQANWRQVLVARVPAIEVLGG